MIMLIGIGFFCQIGGGEAVRADCLSLEIEVVNMGKGFVGGSAADRAGFPVGIVGPAVGGFGSQIFGIFQIDEFVVVIVTVFRAALFADRFLGAGGGWWSCAPRLRRRYRSRRRCSPACGDWC